MWRHQSCQQETTHWCLHRIYRCIKVWGPVRGKKRYFFIRVDEYWIDVIIIIDVTTRVAVKNSVLYPPYFFYIRHVRVCPWSVSNLGAYMSPTPPSPPPHSLALLLLYVPTKLSDPCERTECYWLEINADNNNERSCIRWGEQNEELMLYSCWENIYTYISIADAWWHEWDDSTRRL